MIDKKRPFEFRLCPNGLNYLYKNDELYINENGDYIILEMKDDVSDFLNDLNEKIQEENTLKQGRELYRKEQMIEIEHINAIYKEFGFDGVIDYATTKLGSMGDVREVNDGLFKMVTGGWSDNEDWLCCLNHMLCLMTLKGHYRGYLRGGAFYYTKEPYGKVDIIQVE